MIYLLSVLQLLFLQIPVSKQCYERLQVTGGTKEYSQNGYLYGILSTPNFPNKFPTNFKRSYVIDASYQKPDTLINVYLTQMYLSKGVKFFQRSRLPENKFCDSERKRGERTECYLADDQNQEEIHEFDKLHDLLLVNTSCPYLEIEVTVPELYGYHYRTRDPFLFNVYGFNITYEIVPESLGHKNNSCHARKCSNLGHCYIAEDWRTFFCDCAKDHRGRFCGTSPHCDPEKNITFCHNGGRCKILGPGDGYCECPVGFSGGKCEKRNDQPKVSARTGCSPEAHKGPCSCRPSPRSRDEIPKDWVKYEAIISINQSYTMLHNQSTVGYELQKNISHCFKSNNLSDLHNVLVSFYPSPHGESRPRPQELQIHFHGPIHLKNNVSLLLTSYLFTDTSTSIFRRQIPLVKNSLKLYTMPRVKYKSIEISKLPRLIVGKPASFTCTALTGRSKYFSRRDIHFRWFKGIHPINASISTRHMNVGKTPSADNDTMSVIVIDPVSIYDGGDYTCEVTDLEFGDQECGTVKVEVILPPQIEIEPMSLTLEKRKLDDGVVITCTDGSSSIYNLLNKSIDFLWSRTSSGRKEIKNDEMVVTEDIVPQGKILRILNLEQSESFTCYGINKDGGERHKTVEVKVLDSIYAPSCKSQSEPLLKPTEKDRVLFWKTTASESVAKRLCPEGFSGYVQRPCVLITKTEARWGRTDFSRCISDRLKQLNLTLQYAKNGFGDWRTSNGPSFMSQLENYLNMNQVLYPGEGEKVVAIMDDILKYTFHKGKVSGLIFEVFFRTAGKLLKIPNSCVREKSVLTLYEMMEDMARRGAMYASADDEGRFLKLHIVSSEVSMLQTLPIISGVKYRNISYVFPQKEALKNSSVAWLRNKLHVSYPLDFESFQRNSNSPMAYYLTIAAYKNMSYLLVPKETFPKPVDGKRGFRRSIELISPVVQISMYGGYFIPAGCRIKIHFNLSKEHKSLVSRSAVGKAYRGEGFPETKGTHYSCGAVDNSSQSTKADQGGLGWMNACVMDVQHDGYVECLCEHNGIYGLLKVSNLEDDLPDANNGIPRIIIAGFSFCILSCVLSATIQCVYLKCRVSLNSLYALKLSDCLFIFSAVFIVLLGWAEMPSSSWLGWSASACSLLISSLSVQVTKALRVLLMEATPTPNLPAFILPWLRNVSQISLLSAIIFSTVLPVWTATAAKMIGESNLNESVFQESYVLVIFITTLAIIVGVFLAIYYKAVLKTKGELDGYRQPNSSSAFASEMIWVLTYRMKTLNRSFCITVVLLVMTLGIILYENIRQSIFIQYFLGLSATAMGIVLFLSYVCQSEYPIHLSMCKPDKPLRRDPEKHNFVEGKGSQRKLYEGNGSIVGTTGLLPPPPPPILRNPSRQLGEESETLSVSTVEEQSMDTFSTEMSFRTGPPPAHSQVRQTRSVRSTGSNTKSSNGSSCRGSRRSSRDGKLLQPIRGHCLISSGDYILPSRSVQTESLATSNHKNYLPRHDQSDLQNEISRDLSIILHDK